MKAIIILSGGMDSTTLLYWAKLTYDKIEAISFDYGQKHKKELELAKWHCNKLNIPHKLIDLDFSYFDSSLLGSSDIPEGHYEAENMKSTVVPFRNGIMLSYAVGYAENIGGADVLIGSHSGDHTIYPDCRASFIEAFDRASFHGTYNNILIKTPFGSSKKEDILKKGLQLLVPYEKTWSCYKGNEKACGKCGTCVERLEAFKKNYIEDPIEYE